jgi:aryl-alcohol dehydrogenase-like predicted oxidoreductase
MGTVTFGRTADEAESNAILRRAFELGINFVDTADVYNGGLTEETLGRALRGKRHDVVLASKVCGRVGPGPNDAGLSRRHIMDSVEGSLRRLQTEYLDLYQAHALDPDTPIEETLRALDDLVRQGKVRYIGCSNFAAWQVCEALWVAGRCNLVPFAAVQPRYNLLDRAVERELLPCCRHFGLAVLSYSPLMRGLLTGKYGRGQAPPVGQRLTDVGDYGRFLTERHFVLIERLSAWAQARGRTLGQLAHAWLLVNAAVTSVIVGARAVQQLDEHAPGFDWKLSAGELDEIQQTLDAA